MSSRSEQIKRIINGGAANLRAALSLPDDLRNDAVIRKYGDATKALFDLLYVPPMREVVKGDNLLAVNASGIDPATGEELLNVVSHDDLNHAHYHMIDEQDAEDPYPRCDTCTLDLAEGLNDEFLSRYIDSDRLEQVKLQMGQHIFDKFGPVAVTIFETSNVGEGAGNFHVCILERVPDNG